jgi:hypothetical protein
VTARRLLPAAVAVAALAAGCGGSSGQHSSTRAASSTESATVDAVAHHAARPRHRHGGYGRIPSWLPSAKPPAQRALPASYAHPKLTLQGEALAVSLPGAHLLATAVGPKVPEIGKTPVPATSPVTFVVTFSHVTAPVDLRAGSFVLVDEQHRIHHPRMTALHGGAAPTQLRPGPAVSIELHSVLPTGDGGLEWRPDGRRVIAGWDFNVEID